jgi:hypothetical protein
MRRISDIYYIKWDTIEVISDVENHNLAEESQADGISFDIVSNLYNMSPSQKKLAWEYRFGRLDNARDNYDAAMTIFTQNYPEYDITEIGNKIYNDFITQYTAGSDDATTLYNLQKSLGNLSGYGGYFHPVLPENIPQLWEYITI